eukprot:scaffold17784_cov22-Tisochrysis_lutea.AAC.3
MGHMTRLTGLLGLQTPAACASQTWCSFARHHLDCITHCRVVHDSSRPMLHDNATGARPNPHGARPKPRGA